MCGVAHFARECPSRKYRRDIRNSTSATGGKAQHVSPNTPSQEAKRQPKGRRNDRAVIERTGNGSRSNCFHTAGPKNDADYFTVRVELISGAPTIQALISSFHREFIVDTGTRVSLIQPRVNLSGVSPNNISPFEVTANQLVKRGTREVKFQLIRRELFISFVFFCFQPKLTEF